MSRSAPPRRGSWRPTPTCGSSRVRLSAYAHAPHPTSASAWSVRGCCCPTVRRRSPCGPSQASSAHLLLLMHATRVSARARRALRVAGSWEPAPGEAVPWITGAFVLMRRRAFEEAGGFDAEQWLYGEDMDLCWRMRERGWLIRWEPEAIAHHAHSAAARQAFGDEELIVHIAVGQHLWMLRRRGAFATRLRALAGALVAALQLLASVWPGYDARARHGRAQMRADLRGQTARPRAPRASGADCRRSRARSVMPTGAAHCSRSGPSGTARLTSVVKLSQAVCAGRRSAPPVIPAQEQRSRALVSG